MQWLRAFPLPAEFAPFYTERLVSPNSQGTRVGNSTFLLTKQRAFHRDPPRSCSGASLSQLLWTWAAGLPPSRLLPSPWDLQNWGLGGIPCDLPLPHASEITHLSWLWELPAPSPRLTRNERICKGTGDTGIYTQIFLILPAVIRAIVPEITVLNN